MDLRVPQRVYEQYEQLSEDKLFEVVQNYLTHPNNVQQTVEAEFRNWLVLLGVCRLRPQIINQDNLKDADQWLAFAIRYLIPLCSHYNKPISAEATFRILRERPKLVAALLFSPVEQCIEYLKRGEKAPVGEEFPDPDNIVREIQYSAGVKETLYKRANAVVNRLQVLVVHAFLDMSNGHAKLPALDGSVLLGSKPIDQSYTAVLEWYAQKPELRLLALRELELFKLRTEVGNRLTSRIPWIGGFTLLTILGLAPFAAEGHTLSTVLIPILIVLLGLYIVYVVRYLNDSYMFVRSAIQVFEGEVKYLE